MSTSVNWPLIGGTSYSVPAAGEVNWANLSDFLVALGTKAQGTTAQKVAVREAVTSPITVASTTDCVVISNLTVAGAVAVNLPAGVAGQVFMIVDGKGDANTNNITITPNGAETINGAASLTITSNNGAVIIVFRGTNWTVASEFSGFSTGSIPRSKIAAGTPNEVVINDGSGLLSSEAQLATSRGGTGVNSTATFPTSGVVVTRTSTDTGANRLTNKDLDDDSVKFVDSADTTKVVEFETSGSGTGTTTTLATSSTANRNIILPDANTTVVGRDTSDLGANRLQNKDFDASNTKFVDPSDTTKTVKFDASGSVAGADSTLTFANSGDRVYTFPDGTTTLVGTNVFQTLTEKDIDGGAASNQRRITLPSGPIATLNGLTRKAGTLLYATDTQLVYYDDGATLTPFSANTLATADVAGVVTTFVPTIKSSVNSVSSADYTILDGDGYDTILVSTGASDRTITLPTAADNIGRKIFIKKTDSGAGKVIIDGEGSETIDGALVKNILYQYESYGIVCDGSNWLVTEVDYLGDTSYTPTTGGIGTPTNVFARYYRYQNIMHLRVSLTAGTLAGALLSVSLPSGLTIDSTRVPADNKNYLGMGFASSSGGAIAVAAADIAAIAELSQTNTDIYFATTANTAANIFAAQNANSILGGNGYALLFDAEIPITEWA